MSEKTSSPVKTDYTREELIALCERAIVAEESWSNRDSAAAQKQVGICWALLKAGCRFVVTNPKTSFRTIELTITSDGFNRFENGEGHEDREYFYLPTREKREKQDREDWY